jgi:hypothetical protein
MRNRNGCDHWELMEAGTVYQVEVDLWSTSYIWNTGHQIRIAISSSNYPRCLNNPNTPEGMYKNTTNSVAQNTLYASSIFPSCLLLPEIPLNASDHQQTWIPSVQSPFVPAHPQLQLPERLQQVLHRFPLLRKLLEYRFLMIQ